MPVHIDETQATRALREVQIQARQQWAREGYRVDLAEYEESAMAAITGCLARFDPQRGVSFHTYVAYRIAGAMRDASATYRTWRHGRYWRDTKPHVALLRPLDGPQPDPVLRARLLREVPTLSPRDGDLLIRLLAGEELVDIAEADHIAYITIYMRYRHLLQTLKQRLTAKAPAPARDIPHSQCTGARDGTTPG